MFNANNVAQAHLLLPANTSVCADFAFKGRECAGRNSAPCPHGKRHYYAARQIDKKEMDDIGDSFLVNKDGSFVGPAFRGCRMAPKYDSLFVSNTNRT